jgi:Fe2+ transport system protein B
MQQMNQMEYSAQPPTRQYLSEQQQMEMQNMQQMRLPSRDIPMDMTNYQNDEEIQANYIPKPKVTKDYLKDYEETSEKRIREHEEKKYRENKIDTILTDIQTPILIAFLFFFFQLPIMNTFIFKRFSFMNLYNEDGNFNFSGLVFKSIFFGSVFYSIQKAMTFISEF